MPTEVCRMKKLIPWFVCLLVFGIVAGLDSDCLAQHAPVHFNSISGNGFSHSYEKQFNQDGAYTICESYRNGSTGKRWSKMYTSWDNKWTFYGDHPNASQGRKSPRSPRLPPKKAPWTSPRKFGSKIRFSKSADLGVSQQLTVAIRLELWIP